MWKRRRRPKKKMNNERKKSKMIIVASSQVRSRFSHLPYDRKVAALSGIDSKAKQCPLRADQVIMAIGKEKNKASKCSLLTAPRSRSQCPPKKNPITKTLQDKRKGKVLKGSRVIVLGSLVSGLLGKQDKTLRNETRKS